MDTCRALLAAALVPMGLLPGCRAAPPGDRAPRPNVILLMADDLGWGDLGHRGHPHAQTPNLDAMAAAGLRFERFYAAAPVCSPTRGSCLTGRHPYRYGITSANVGHLPAAEVNLAQLLGDAGYATGHFGKWHLGTLTRTVTDSNRGGPRGAEHYAPPWERGFEVSFSTEAKVPTFDPMVHPDSGEAYGTFYWQGEDERVREGLEGDDSRVIVDRVLPFVEDAVEAGRPFFAVVWFHTPHLPVRAAAADRAPFADLPPEHQHYFGSIRALDREVGRLREHLIQLGVSRDTLVWFASDNGPEGRGETALGSTGGLRGRKRSLYEGGIRVPGWIEWPARVAPGSVSDLPAVTSDILPTVCELAGLALPPAELDGVSLVPWLEGSRAPRDSPIGFEHGGRVAWIDGARKLVGRLAPREGPGPRAVVAWELYDLARDPGETRDLWPEQGAQAAQAVAAFSAWRSGR